MSMKIVRFTVRRKAANKYCSLYLINLLSWSKTFKHFVSVCFSM